MAAHSDALYNAPVASISNLDGMPEDHKIHQDHSRDRDMKRKYAYGTKERRDSGKSIPQGRTPAP
jgi:hypothetical protein